MKLSEVITLAKAGYKKADIEKLLKEEKPAEAPQAEAPAEAPQEPEAAEVPAAEKSEEVEPTQKKPEEPEEEKTDYKALYEKAIAENRRLNLEPLAPEEKTIEEIFRETIF